MFKNFRNKVAVLALVALGLAFGHASDMQPAKPTTTNGELIYEAIIKGELPDETSGMWEIAHEVAQEEKEQKEEQEHEVAQEEKEQNGEQEQEGKEPKDADNSTSNRTIITLTAEIRSKIKTAIELLLKNDDVVKYITIHNIASGHMHRAANKEKGEINAGIEKLPSLNAEFAKAFLDKKCESYTAAYLHKKFGLSLEDASACVGLRNNTTQDLCDILFYKQRQLDLNDYGKYIYNVSEALTHLKEAVKHLLEEQPPKKAKLLINLCNDITKECLSKCVGNARQLKELIKDTEWQKRLTEFVCAYDSLRLLQDKKYSGIMEQIDNVIPRNLRNVNLFENISRLILMHLAYTRRFLGNEESLCSDTKKAISEFLERQIEISSNDRGQFALVSGKTKLILTIYKDAERSQVYINHFGPANN